MRPSIPLLTEIFSAEAAKNVALHTPHIGLCWDMLSCRQCSQKLCPQLSTLGRLVLRLNSSEQVRHFTICVSLSRSSTIPLLTGTSFAEALRNGSLQTQQFSIPRVKQLFRQDLQKLCPQGSTLGLRVVLLKSSVQITHSIALL